ncbi:hypothetical protein HRbin36_01606 [bacterium HR36]|nr:hypothetical protein HRbin36_01606 [bacterium HR36]
MNGRNTLSPAEAAQEYVRLLELISQFFDKSSPREFTREPILYAAAVVRNYLLRCLEEPQSPWQHVAVIGGGGAGKSTVVNILLGERLAEANPQAGYTRHPSAFCEQVDHCRHVLPRLRPIPNPVPADVDDDIYDIRCRTQGRLPTTLIIWDTPDVTTIHAAHYTHRVLEVLGLADAVIYVASAQRYNDVVPSLYFSLCRQSGKPTIACLTKIPERETENILCDFQEKILGPASAHIPCIVIPYMSADALCNPDITQPYRQQLLQALEKWFGATEESRGNSGLTAHASAAPHKEGAYGWRGKTCRQILQYLANSEAHWRNLLQPELVALQQWRQLVQQCHQAILQRYRQEFLAAERLPIFDEAMVRLLEILEVPIVSNVLAILRLPWTLLGSLLGKARTAGRGGPLQQEQESLENAVRTALGQLWYEVQRRQHDSAFWMRLRQGLDPNSRPDAQILSLLRTRFAAYERARNDCIETIARSIYADLESRPMALNALRGIKLSLELGSIGGILLTAGINVWDFVLVPLATSAIQAIAEVLSQGYVVAQREAAKQMQWQLVAQHVLEPVQQAIFAQEAIRDWLRLEKGFAEMARWREKLAHGLSSGYGV